MAFLNSRKFVLTAALFVSAMSAAAAQHLFADITGKWTITSDSPNGALQSTAVMKQDSTALSGTIDIPQIGSSKLSGTVKGDTVNYSFGLDMGGTQIQVNVVGVLKDKDNMAGTIYLPQEMGNYPFTAKRTP